MVVGEARKVGTATFVMETMNLLWVVEVVEVQWEH